MNGNRQAVPHNSHSVSKGFVKLLEKLDISVAVTSYQSGGLYLLGRHPNGNISLQERLYHRAMGMFAENETLLLAGLFQIHRFENILKAGQNINNTYDTCYLPRASYTTGALDIHDISRINGEIVFVNTKFNCIAKLSERESFTPVWKPFFINGLYAEDRCHLNGMAVADNQIVYATAVSQTNQNNEWRDHRNNGGIVIDVLKNEIICSGLSMPHSPRIYNGRLWVLNSGTGEFGTVDITSGKFEPLTFLPGFGRGLVFKGKYAFIGLSKPRYKRFEGLAIADRLAEKNQEAFCGVQVIDIETGKCVEWFKADDSVTEVFDVAVLNHVRCPMSVSFESPEIMSIISHEIASHLPAAEAAGK